MATSDCISSRKSQRMKRKAAKMTALVNLSKPLSNEMDTKSTSHEKLIQQLEQQLNDSSDDQSLPYADQGDEDDDYNADTNIYSAYRKLMNKRRKIELSRKVVTIYIDQPFLSLRRRKNLLYNEELQI
ncbi:hypothetical protein EB796_013788 [Bugula neritina]|uniref:Uncharacterized protein n=1 Tax=Bugula neritina TaxID=10212 RepID=A0A7J7JPF9_BUGNE|nr:hypothetical protein EB796_013788 [Bugula neritina]